MHVQFYRGDLLSWACPKLKGHIDYMPYIHVLLVRTSALDECTLFSYIWDTRKITHIATLSVTSDAMQQYFTVATEDLDRCRIDSVDNRHILYGDRKIIGHYEHMLYEINTKVMNAYSGYRCTTYVNHLNQTAFYRNNYAVIFDSHGKILKADMYSSSDKFREKEGQDFKKAELTDTRRSWLLQHMASNEQAYKSFTGQYI